MPREPYQPFSTIEPEAIPAPQQHPVVSPAAFGAGVAEAEQKAGGQISSGADQLNRAALEFAQMNASTVALNATTGASKELGNLLVDFRQKQGSNAVDAFPAFQKSVSDLQQRYADSITNPRAKLAFMTDFRNYADRTIFDAGSHVADQAVKAHVGALSGAIEEEQSRATRNAILTGQTPDFSKLIGLNAQLGQTNGWSKDQVNASIQNTSSKMISDVIDGQIAAANPNDFNRSAAANAFYQSALRGKIPGTDLPFLNGQAIEAIGSKIQSTQWMDQMRQETAQRRADAAQNKYAATLRVNLTHVLSNAEAMQKYGSPAPLPTDQTIDKAFPTEPDKAAIVKAQVDDMRQVNGFLPMVQTATKEQLDATAMKLRPDPAKADTFAFDARRYAAFQTAVKTRETALSTDPAIYIMSGDPTLRAAYEGAVKDPKTFPAYAQAMMGSQSTMGLTPLAQHVLPADTAQKLVAAITEDPNKSHDILGAMKTQYGSSWQPVWHDLVTLGKLPTGFQAVEDIHDPTQASYLARALAVPKADGKSLKDIVPELIMGKGTTSIDNLVGDDPRVQQFMHALDGAHASDAMKASLLTSMRTLAYANVVYGSARDGGTAAQTAIDAFVGHYAFLPNGGAMIPASSLDNVTANMDATLGRLDAGKLAVPAIYGRPGQPTVADYIRSVQANPTWKTAPDGASAVLYDPQGRIVRQTNGDVVSVNFSAPAPLGTPIEAQDLIPGD